MGYACEIAEQAKGMIMRKEDWEVVYSGTQGGYSGTEGGSSLITIYRLKQTILHLEVYTYEEGSIPTGLTFVDDINRRRNYISIENLMLSDAINEDDKVSLAYYINAGYVAEMKDGWMEEFLTEMHGGIKKWKEFATETSNNRTIKRLLSETKTTVI
jgi:hypothetical protein